MGDYQRVTHSPESPKGLFSISFFAILLCVSPSVTVLAQPTLPSPADYGTVTDHRNEEADDLSLYYGWLDNESRDSTYLKAYCGWQADTAAATVSSVSVSETARELETLSAAFTEAFWVDKDYDGAFYIGFQMEERLPLVTESEYPGKRRDWFKLGEAYYLFLDNHKSIELLEKALSPAPLSFNDRTNLDALKIIGICYANIEQWQQSDDYFRATLLSSDIVLGRPVYNAYAVSHLGCNAMLNGRYNLALRLSAAAWPVLRKETEDYGHLAGMCYCRGRSYLQKGDFRRASQWIDSLVFFAPRDTYNPVKRIEQAYRLQADYYSALGDARLTQVYGDSLVNTYDTDYRLNTSQYIARAAQKFNAERIAEQESQLRVSRHGMIVISVMALLSIAVAACMITLYRKRNAAYKVLARKAEEWARQGTVSPVSSTPGRAAADKAEPPKKEDRRIMALVDREMIENHAYRDPDLTAESLADRLDVHRNALSHAVNRTTGGNFNNYVNSHRIKEAVQIISENDGSKIYIDELYGRVGFNSHTSFYRAFKQFTGISPADFRKNQSTKT